jgi:hypothetical protein
MYLLKLTHQYITLKNTTSNTDHLLFSIIGLVLHMFMYAIRINVFKRAASHICIASSSQLLAKQWLLTDEKLTEQGQACVVDAIRSQTVPAGVFQQCGQQ